MANCESKLTADIINDCDIKPKAGIEVNVDIINFDDIDKIASTLDVTNDLIITNLATKSGTTGYSLEGIKQVNGVSFELVKKEDSYDMFSHLFSGVILTPSSVNKALLKEMASGSRYVVVVEKKWKGDTQIDAFEVLGWDAGLVISTVVYSSKEANGAIKFELKSEEGYEESDMTRTNFETDYATTKVAFDAKYATA